MGTRHKLKAVFSEDVFRGADVRHPPTETVWPLTTSRGASICLLRKCAALPGLLALAIAKSCSLSVSSESEAVSKLLIFTASVSKCVRAQKGQEMVRITTPVSLQGLPNLDGNNFLARMLHKGGCCYSILGSSCQFFRRYRKPSFDCAWT